MPNDIASLLLALTVSMITMAVALPAVMGQVNAAARRAQVGVGLQSLGWVLLLLSEMAPAGSWTDRLLSTLSMAGIAGWSFALRLARWPDTRPVWTGSCPCQPFSGTFKLRRRRPLAEVHQASLIFRSISFSVTAFNMIHRSARSSLHNIRRACEPS